MDYLVTATQAPGIPGQGKQNPTLADSMTRLDPNKLPGACRWDAERSNTLGSEQACLCPATKSTCSVDRSECYWYQMPEEKALKLKNQGVGYVPTFACINSAERFYYLLAGLLKKRGKKDFAIKIRYGATPARGKLPLGPWGPAIIGHGHRQSMMGHPMGGMGGRMMGHPSRGIGGGMMGHPMGGMGGGMFGRLMHGYGGIMGGMSNYGRRW